VAPLPATRRVVDLDVPNRAFDRAEWIEGNLRLGRAPRGEDATRYTECRIVGAEPRQWEVHGVPNVRTELSMSGLRVRVPMVRADLSLLRSSY